MESVLASLKTNLVPLGIPSNYIERDNLIIFLLVIYIAFVSIWTPRVILAFINQPVIRIAVMVFIIWVFTWNKLIALFVAIAFVATLSIDQSIIVSKAYSSGKQLGIIDRSGRREHFENAAGGDIEDDEEYLDSEDDAEYNDTEGFEDKGHLADSEDNNMEEDEEEEDDYDEEDENLKNKNLTDTFRNLHDSIHKLEQFISKNKKE